jgi:hypothetical protein
MIHTSDIKDIFESIQLHSPTQYSIKGVVRTVSQAQQQNFALVQAFSSTLPTEDSDDIQTLMPYLENDLYSKFYVKPQDNIAPNAYSLQARDFISELSKANNGIGTWESGWKVLSIEDSGRIKVTKDNVFFWVDKTGIRTNKKDIQPNTYCRIRIVKEMRQLVSGFYMAIGNGDNNNQNDTMRNLVRLYWNLTPEIAPTYMKLVTERLNSSRIPFRTKVLSNPNSYTRADSGVLYIEKIYFSRIKDAVNDIYHQIKNFMKPDVPLFTKYLHDGLGLAEDPGNGMSFGMSRCKILANSLCLSFSNNYNDHESKISALEESFKKEGLNPEYPYLERNSKDVYHLS